MYIYNYSIIMYKYINQIINGYCPSEISSIDQRYTGGS